MAEMKKRFQKLRLTMLFAAIVFAIMFLSILLVLAGMAILRHLGIIDESFIIQAPIIIFALASLGVGTFVAVLLSNAPLKPIREIMAATEKIADGDYSVRLDLKGPEEMRILGRKFSHMAEELGSVEMLRSDFINNFSHEFKTPIISIRGFAKILKEDNLTEEERQEYLGIIIDESERLTDLATNVLNLSKVEQQTILTDKKRFNVSEQIRLVIAMLDGKWLEKHIEFSFDCEETFLTGNEEMLKQVWINLLDNAIKFSPSYGKVDIAITAQDGKVVFSFTNQGEGISQEAAAHIFDKFYQGDTSHTTKGNGLGLTIAKKIVELHKGSIYVDSLSNGLTTFKVELSV